MSPSIYGYAVVEKAVERWQPIAGFYCFEKGSHTDNSIFCIFTDDNRHDALISIAREYGDNWPDKYDLRRVKIEFTEETKEPVPE